MRLALRLISICLLILQFSAIHEAQPTRTPVPGGNGDWFVENAERAVDVRFAEFAGRQAMWLRNNTQVIRSDAEFADGTIEFDVAPMENGNFVGILFRRESATYHENIYLRLHRSGLYNALQYSPRINGSSTWQLYPEFNSNIALPRLAWTRLRVEVRGARLEVFVNGEKEPVLKVDRLRGPTGKGRVAFWGRVNDKPQEWGAALSNISIRPRVPDANAGPLSNDPDPGSLKGFLTEWEAADGGPATPEPGFDVAKLKDWKRANAEENGLVNLNRIFTVTRGRRTAFARTFIESAEAGRAKLELGYSDDVVVYLNGAAVYNGVNSYESRHPEFMGFVKPGFENVFLDLRRGRNELVLAVTDGQVFGWGFAARLIR
ncbi:MAG: family 16 glycoside hydrolase [Pyrinomonadaceae bacterium]